MCGILVFFFLRFPAKRGSDIYDNALEVFGIFKLEVFNDYDA